MKRLFGFPILSLLFGLMWAGNGEAHHVGDHAVVLHTNTQWDDCAIVLDPSLTLNEWKTFSRDLASIIYFKPTTGAKPLGKGRFDVGLEQATTAPLKDYNGSWNNTFSHPSADHWLTGDNHRLSIPVITGRYGVTEKLDMGLLFTDNWNTNYGWVGFDVKYVFHQDRSRGLYYAARWSTVVLTGVQDMDYYQGATDLLISRDVGRFTPYAGVTGTYSVAKEETDKVDLIQQRSTATEGILGTQFHWRHLSMSAEVDFARINMYTLKIGVAI
ncbi:MAG: hypothetical protein OEW11_00250 [Nitrospirota bacterium]|nr:hypothetical protein [Nitrospirota bacterium]